MKKRLFVFACVLVTSAMISGCNLGALKSGLQALADAIPDGTQTSEELASSKALETSEIPALAEEAESESVSDESEKTGVQDDGKSENGDKDGEKKSGSDEPLASSVCEDPDAQAEKVRRENQEKQRQERLEKEKAEEEERLRKEEEEKAKKEAEEKAKKEKAEKERQEQERIREEEEKKAEEERKAAEEAQKQQQQNSIADLEANAGTRMIELINQKRAEAGLGPLTLDPTLCSLAKIRSDEIVSVFDHTRPDGRSCFTVFSDNGVTYMAAGENIAAGYPTVEDVFNGWMNSEGHRANLLSPSFGKIGIGFTYSDGGYRYYWAQVFSD